jgi:hypothetical protein
MRQSIIDKAYDPVATAPGSDSFANTPHTLIRLRKATFFIDL